MTRHSVVRISGYLSADATMAVILSQGPEGAQILTWDLTSDVVTPGEWIDAHVFQERCDLTPRGDLFVGSFTREAPGHLFARIARLVRGERRRTSWTAISRPPFFAPLAIWPSEGTYHTGGIWRDDGTVAILPSPDEPIEPAGPDGLPTGFTIERLPDEAAGRSWWMDRLERFGWQAIQRDFVSKKAPGTRTGLVVVGERVFERRFAGGRLVRSDDTSRVAWRAIDEHGVVHLNFEVPQRVPQWLDIDHRDRVVYGDEGCLWAWAGFPEGEPQRIADLTVDRSEAIEPPDWAREWPA